MEWVKAKANESDTELKKFLGEQLVGWVKFHPRSKHSFFTAHPAPEGVRFETEEEAKAAIMEEVVFRSNEAAQERLERMRKVERRTAA